MHPVVVVASRTPGQMAVYLPPLTATLTAPLAALEARLRSLDITVVYTDVPDALLAAGQVPAGNIVWGLALPDEREVYLLESLSPDGRFEVLTHEAAHILQPGDLNSSASEVFAELVLYEMLYYYGHDGSVTVGQYLAGHKAELPLVPFISVDVRFVRDVLLGKADVWK